MKTLRSDRLILRPAVDGDADFLYKLLNEEDYLKHIGDRGVRSPSDALNYLRTAQIFRYENDGLGLNIVEALDSGSPVGICGLVKRAELSNVDLGYAICVKSQGFGFATEAASLTLRYAIQDLKLRRVVAITSFENNASQRVLLKIGMRFEGIVRLDNRADNSLLFAISQ